MSNQRSDAAIYDRRGIPILPGDTVKIFHFVAALRRERRFMYKFAVETFKRGDGLTLLRMSHLNVRQETYWLVMDGSVLADHEIVQGYAGVEIGGSYRDRKRKSR
ncbi:MAG: hypothetical protein EBY17_29035 [Acidobacteriia bacterium]|nr:hypothetical protein [Terriglobia bacterium]